jgi:tRNA N6-adenosine threonylcarbamoyltransferase
MPSKILAIETSCDETSASVLRDNEVLSNVISSQLFHNEFGGIVPELASRAQITAIDKVVNKALEDSETDVKDINLTAATRGPGLIGSLLTGLNYAKGFAIARKINFIGINHIESHLYSCFIGKKEIDFPFLALVVSGGHTVLSSVSGYFEYEILGQTQDDAAGEAFDKGAKMLGLGYPGGPLIDKLAKEGDENYHKFPVSSVRENMYDFSFSGIKTSLLYYLRKTPGFNENLADICASYQKAVVDSLTEKVITAAENLNIKKIAVSGGVSANSRLREELFKFKQKGYEIYFPGLEYTTDNAAMVGYAAYLKDTYSSTDYGREIHEPAFARFEN